MDVAAAQRTAGEVVVVEGVVQMEDLVEDAKIGINHLQDHQIRRQKNQIHSGMFGVKWIQMQLQILCKKKIDLVI